jgi:hypothetical protein
MYTINVAKQKGRNWNNTGWDYSFYFRVELDYIEETKQLTKELMWFYPSPQYCISVSKSTTTRTDLLIADNM